MTTRAEVVATARAWIGTPFREQQSVRGHGADCVGAVKGIGEEAASLQASVKPWKQSPDNGRLEKECRTHLQPIPLGEMQPGDVVLIGRPAHHIGVLVDYRDGQLGIVHSLKARGGVVEHRLDSKGRASISAAFRYPSVT